MFHSAWSRVWSDVQPIFLSDKVMVSLIRIQFPVTKQHEQNEVDLHIGQRARRWNDQHIHEVEQSFVFVSLSFVFVRTEQMNLRSALVGSLFYDGAYSTT